MNTLTGLPLIAPPPFHLTRTAQPTGLRVPIAATTNSTGVNNVTDYEGEPSGREIVATRMKEQIQIRSIESWLSQPVQSTFTDAQIVLASDVQAIEIGDLPSKLSGASIDYPDDHVPDIAPDVEFTSIRLSPSGVVFGLTHEAELSSALALTHSQGGGEIWLQNDARQWFKRFDMAAYLLRAYFASKWSNLIPFDSSQPLPRTLPIINNFHTFKQRQSLVHIKCQCWSSKFDAPLISDPLQTALPVPFILLAVGTRGGVVSIWKFSLPILNSTTAAVSVTNSLEPSPPTPNTQHPELVGSFNLPEGAIVSQLAFSPVYYDTARHTTVCSLAVGATNGRAYVHAIEPYARNKEVNDEEEKEEEKKIDPAASSVRPLPIINRHLLTVSLGNSFMSVGCLQWSQILSTSNHPTAASSTCAFCYSGVSCQRYGHQAGVEVHHLLAISCVGQLQAIALHPNEYLSPSLPTSSATDRHTSVCRIFSMLHAHSAAINSLVWCIQATSQMHPDQAQSSLASHHIQLLSSSDDDIVHRWLVRDNHDRTISGSGLVQCDSSKMSDLSLTNGTGGRLSRLQLFPESAPLRGSHGLLRSGDGILLYSFEYLSLGLTGESVVPSNLTKKRTNVGVIRATPYPFLDVPDEDRQAFARLSIAYSTIWTGDAPIAPDAPTFNVPPKPEPSSTRSMIDILAKQELEERRQQAAAKSGQTIGAANPTDNGGVAMMELDTPEPPQSATKPAASPATLGLATVAPTSQKKPPLRSSQKKKKVRRPIGSVDQGDDDDEDDEWKDGGVDVSGDDDEYGEDDPSDDDASVKSSKKASSLKRKKEDQELLRYQKKKQKLLASCFARAEDIPIPVPVQANNLEAERKQTQQRIIRVMTQLWLGQLIHQIQAQQVRSQSSDTAAGSSSRLLPFTLSAFSWRSLVSSLSNPFHLSIPPSLTELPTSLLPEDEIGADLPLDMSSPAMTPFSLFWRLAPRILPPNLFPAGYDSLFRILDMPETRVFPLEAFSLPMHRQLPFIFATDALLETAETMLKDVLSNTSLVNLWMDSLTTNYRSTSTLPQQFKLRLILSLTQLALASRSPFLALSSSERTRCESLHARLMHLFQFQHLTQYLHSFTDAMDLTSSMTQLDRLFMMASALPFPVPLLMADYIVQAILGIQHDEEEIQQEIWKHSNAVPLLRLAYQVYALLRGSAESQLVWFQQFFTLVGLSSDGATGPLPSTPTLIQTITELRHRWPLVAREKCVLCEQGVRLESLSHGRCVNGHVLPRCRRTFLLVSNIATLACHNCNGTTIILAGQQTQLCSCCWSATHVVAESA